MRLARPPGHDEAAGARAAGQRRARGARPLHARAVGGRHVHGVPRPPVQGERERRTIRRGGVDDTGTRKGRGIRQGKACACKGDTDAG
eukprot:8574221-Pyramimonas_sp.AAC.1